MPHAGDSLSPAAFAPVSKRPRRYLTKARCVLAWHGFHVQETGGDYPTLAYLAFSTGIARTTVHRLCIMQGLALSQTRTRL